MVAAEKYALNHECAPNNEVLRIKLSSYISFRYTREMRQRERERQGDNLAHSDTKSRVTAWKLSYVTTTCTSTGIFGLPALVSGLLFVFRCGERVRFVYCFGHKIFKMRDGGPHTENHLLCHDYRFHVTHSDWKLRYHCVSRL